MTHIEEKETINYLLESGMSFKEILSCMKSDISLEEMADALRSREARGLPPAEDPEEKKKDERSVLTLELLSDFLEEAGISVQYNVISKEVQIDGLPSRFNPETLSADIHIILHDQLKRVFKCSKDQVADLLNVIGGVRRFNPVLDMLRQAEWDRRDRLPELFDILHLPKDDALSRILISKWMVQGVAMARNQLPDAYGADGVLVLNGGQGIGKTTLVKKLGMRPGLYKLGQWLDTRDKDTARRCTSAWIVELGELETTLRSDLERLKAFITAERDEYRLPYARTDQILARRTSLIATCNTDRFLIDPTGSRRFWTVPLTKIDLDRLEELDALQLWKQAEAALDRDAQGFRLTKLEQELLYKRNAFHEKPLKAQMEVEDILQEAQGEYGYIWTDMTVSDFKSEHELLRVYSVEQIGKALDKLGIFSRRIQKNGSRKWVRKLPKRFYRESGKGGIDAAQ